jgi:serine/threonine protein kinase
MTAMRTDFRESDVAPVWSCPPGTELPGGFLAWKRLRVGSRCETWLVWSVSLWCPAVLKLPRPHQIDHPLAACSLGREVTALRDQCHPALPRLYADGTTADIPYLAMEYIDGPALDEELRSFLSEPEVALLGAQLLTGLLALHRRGIALVDLNPRAVILRDQRPVIIDFGSARRIGSTLPGATATLGYAAPELPSEPISAGMDLYSLGKILSRAHPGSRTPLADLITRLHHPDPAKRPYTHEALTTFAATLPPDLRPWPPWADPFATL